MRNALFILHSLFFGLSLLAFSALNAQNFGNEWIDFNQRYYKIHVTQNRLHRVGYDVLNSAGIPLANLDPRNFQLFFRGEEMPIFISGGADGSLDPGDYIEFIGRFNDGWLDTSLYKQPQSQATPGFSIYSDTATFYLTWNTLTTNKRFITQTDTNVANYTQAPYRQVDLKIRTATTSYYVGPLIQGVSSPFYEEGTGFHQIINPGTINPLWTSGALNNYKSFLVGNAPALLELRVVSANNPNTFSADHIREIKVGNTLLTRDTLDGFTYRKYSYALNGSDFINSGTSPFSLAFLGTFSGNSRNGLSEYRLILPLSFNFGGRIRESFILPPSGGTKTGIVIQGFNPSGGGVWLYDIKNRMRIPVQPGGGAGNYRTVVPFAGETRECFISAASDAISVTSIQAVNGNGKFRDFKNTVINFDYLVITHGSLLSSAQKIGNFRNFTGYKSLTLTVEELYDQFAHGIFAHPVAIRRFLEFAWTHWDTKPMQAFLIGKGFSPETFRGNATFLTRLKVPGFGQPSSDMPFGYRLLGLSGQQVAIGRLAAETPQDVEVYLSKLQAFETVPVGMWMKNFVFLSGGISASEQQTLGAYVNGYAQTIENFAIAAKAHRFSKNTSAPIQYNAVDSIRSLVNNEGISFMTVFGHGSGQGFDQNIDQPQNYNNKDKYFIVLANSCFSGDIFSPSRLIAESFVFEPEKAAVGFIASSVPGLSSRMDVYSKAFFQQLSNQPLGRSLGMVLRSSISSLAADSAIQNTAMQMLLHGDPALRLRIPAEADLFVREDRVILPSEITNEADSMEIVVLIGNSGAAVSDTVLTTLRWIRNNGTDTTLSRTLAGVKYSDTLRFWIHLSPDFIGNQTLEVLVDPNFLIPEVSKANNFLQLNFTIKSSAILPIYPPRYAVVPNARPLMRASTGDPFAPLRSYRMEMDTIPSFNSPYLKDTLAQSAGGVITWNPFIQLPDSQVVYWRVSVDSVAPQWRKSSFQYINQKSGWGQARFLQITDDSFVYLEQDTATEKFSFSPVRQKVRVEVQGCMGPGSYQNTRYFINNVLMEENGCLTSPAIHVAVIDPITLLPWETGHFNPTLGQLNPQNNFGNINHNFCKNRAERYFIYWLNDGNQQSGLNSLIDAAPSGSYIIAYTYFNGVFSPAKWPEFLIQKFESLGADSLRTLVNQSRAVPYIFVGKKGDPSLAVEQMGTVACDFISQEADIETDWVFGTITSPVIGPAKQWNTLTWQTISLESVPKDTTRLSVFGIKENGQEDLLIPTISPGTQILGTLSDSIDAQTYPYLKLQLFTRNDLGLIPKQLKQWHVLYETVPELALNPAQHFVFKADTLSRSETFLFSTAISNIGSQPTDSVPIRYRLTAQNNQSQIFTKNLAPTLPGDHLIDTFQINTLQYPGLNRFKIEVNPPDFSTHFKEITLFNNNGEKNFFVATDKTNPLLDVTFDGVHIMDGDIVSAKPNIFIQLLDENPLLALDDTSAFDLYLRSPNENQPKRIALASPDIAFSPAVLPQNKASIHWSPDFTNMDGRYELLLRARDKSNNASGSSKEDYDFRIRFEVVGAATITQVMNYPNPFSTSTRFVFTLTGAEVPHELTIRIMTVSGIVVREITQQELGPIRIGRNITEYAWDGNDEFGAPLASGVYIYKVYAKMNGEIMERRNSGADKFFKDGFGKMYLMR
jgi:hypothetical protein